MKRFTLLLFPLLFCSFAFADTFVVTTNADSGPGSLREAVIQANANGTTITDNIIFNIADVSIGGRTISLLTPYADLTSKIIIDGTTQPGPAIGVSSAKIRITNPAGVGIEYVFRVINQGIVEIYGLHFDNLNVIIGSAPSANAIQLHNSNNIKIGAAGKGNYFTRLASGVTNTFLPFPGKGLNNGLSFKGNIVNLSEDGNSIVPGSFAMAINIQNVKNLEIGGELPGEGNHMCTIADAMVSVNTDTLDHINLGYARIINNKMGCNYTETAGLTCGYIYLQNTGSWGYTDTTDILVKGNSFNAFAYAFSNNLKTFIKVEGKKGFLDIKNNRIGLLGNPAVNYFSIISSAIIVGNCENGIIGGDNTADTNFIAGCIYNGIAVTNNKNIRITKNSIFCNGKGILASSSLVSIPKTKIFTITNNMVQGTSMPNSTVEIFLTQICAYCDNGKTYLGNCLADGAGNWTFNSPVVLNGAVTATGTSTQGVTGEFAKPEYTQSNFTTRNPTCNQNNGFIHGMQFVAGTGFYWAHSYNGVYDTLYTEDLDNIGPGTYKFVVEQGSYCSVSFTVNLYDNSPKLYFQNVVITQPSCGLNNGRIISHMATGSYNKIIWKDAANSIVGNTLDLLNAAAGQYKLIILDTTYGCGDSSGFYTLINQSGPSLNTGNVQITSATCSSNNGSITGITASNVSGTPFIRWVDSVNNPVGNALDLVNAFPGKYRLKFKDASGCDTIITPYYIIPDIGTISINSTNKLITPSKCSGNTGSIQQVLVTGGNNYNWINTATNTTVGNNLDIFNLAVGNYQLIVTNNYGCSKTSPVFNVPLTVFVPIDVISFTVQHALCLQNTGIIRINTFSNDSTLYGFKWIDSISGQVVGGRTWLSNLPAGNYMLFATDSNGCEKKIFSKAILGLPVPVFDYSQEQIINSSCGLKNGSISSLKINGLTGPSTYTWYDQNNQVVGNSINLLNEGAGTYVLHVTDAGICNFQSRPFTLTNANNILEAPLYDDLLIQKNSTAVLNLKNPAAGTYILYTDASATQSIQQNNSGNFSIPGIVSDTVFYIKRTNGTCASIVVPIKIKVVSVTVFTIPTAFTPNGDGLNDRLTVKVTGYLDLSYFRIYNKWGELVFETRRLNDSWDGFYKRVLQNTGSFIWKAEGVTRRGFRVSDQGSFVLIR